MSVIQHVDAEIQGPYNNRCWTKTHICIKERFLSPNKSCGASDVEDEKCCTVYGSPVSAVFPLGW